MGRKQKEVVTIKLNYYDLIFLDSLKKTTKTSVSTTTLWLEFKTWDLQIFKHKSNAPNQIFSVGYSKNSMLIQNMKQCKCTAGWPCGRAAAQAHMVSSDKFLANFIYFIYYIHCTFYKKILTWRNKCPPPPKKKQ